MKIYNTIYTIVSMNSNTAKYSILWTHNVYIRANPKITNLLGKSKLIIFLKISY